MFLFTSLLGAQSDSPAQQSLLELDNGIKILIDVGWDSTFDLSLLAELERHAPTIDLILLTHPTIEHMGAYAHACKHIPHFNAIPVYSTFPVSNLGRLLLQDIYLSSPKAFGLLVDLKAGESTPKAEDLSPLGFLPDGEASDLPEFALKLPPTPAEIDSYCGKIVTLKFSQPTPLHSAVSRVAGKLGSITITAYSAGHTLGGTIWKIQQSQESIVYAVDWNLSRDNCLRGAGFLSNEDGRVQEVLRRPSALVCSARNAQISNIAGGRKRRDELLLDTIRKVAKEQGGTVLIPTDSVGRILELSYLLEHAWRHDSTLSGKQGNGVGLHLAGRKVKRLSQVVGSMLEWMDEAVVKEFEAIAESGAKNERRGKHRRKEDDDDGKSADSGNKAGPFDFLHVNLVSTPSQLAKILNTNDGRGKVIIASDSSLEWGLSRDALIRVANDEKNIVILTERGDGKAGLAGQIWKNWKATSQQQQDDPIAGAINSLSVSDELSSYAKTPLLGTELKAYERHMAAQKALSTQQLTLLGAGGLPSADQEEDEASSSSDDDSDSERQGKALTTAASKKVSQATLMIGGAPPSQTKADIGVNVLLKGEGVYDFDVRGAKGRNRMFPFQIRRKRVDEYGEVLRPDDFTRAEERMDEDAPDTEEQIKTETDSRVMGKKRKWQESDKLRHGHNGSGSGNKSKSTATSVTTESAKRKRKHGGGSRNLKKRRPRDSDAMSDSDNPSDTYADSSSSDSDTLSSTESHLTTPHKLLITTTTITIRVRATFIDFSGLHDQNALGLLLPLIDPTKLILTGGRAEETQHLANFYREKARAINLRRVGQGAGGRETEVYYPQRGERVDASVDTNAWTVKLAPSLARELKWQKVGTLGVVHVLGQVVVADEASAGEDAADGEPGGKRRKMIEPSSSSSTALVTSSSLNAGGKAPHLLLDLLPPSLLAATRSVAQPIHVGDIKLADLRRVLQAEGHTAEFRGEGTLLVDGVVVVRKSGVGNVSIEDGGSGFLGGRLGMGGNANGGKGTFVKVRRKVYEGLAVVAGG
ncbi:hypothetical protein EX30DRAFT_337769 [Ascodesmis nigricans]|uniref:Cleavage and polyadenylation specificity factor subunit 2 n=1 Tax=Ascodesmis nigricans TaxID=341454 RepID=A0A4S2N857_9PEZI|nr:hypothetical protein EX30DRAFT_337769 [Ascodesmis nigricans]